MNTATPNSKFKNDEKQDACRACRKCFKFNSHLLVHNRIHSGERPYHCDVCNKIFARKHVLKTH